MRCIKLLRLCYEAAAAIKTGGIIFHCPSPLLRGEQRAHIKALYLVIGNLSTITPGGCFVVLKIAGHHLIFSHFPSVGARSPNTAVVRK